MRPARLEALAKAIPGPAPWARLAVCRDTPGVDFFVEAVRNRVDMQTRRSSGPRKSARGAQCLSCLEAGLREPFGIWGGLTVRERRKLREAAKRPLRTPNKKGTTMAQPTIPEAIAEAQPAKLKPNGPRLRPDGSMMTPARPSLSRRPAAAGRNSQARTTTFPPEKGKREAINWPLCGVRAHWVERPRPAQRGALPVWRLRSSAGVVS